MNARLGISLFPYDLRRYQLLLLLRNFASDSRVHNFSSSYESFYGANEWRRKWNRMRSVETCHDVIKYKIHIQQFRDVFIFLGDEMSKKVRTRLTNDIREGNLHQRFS